MKKGTLATVGSGDWILSVNGGPETSSIEIGRYQTRGALYRACRAINDPNLKLVITRDTRYEFVIHDSDADVPADRDDEGASPGNGA